MAGLLKWVGAGFRCGVQCFLGSDGYGLREGESRERAEERVTEL